MKSFSPLLYRLRIIQWYTVDFANCYLRLERFNVYPLTLLTLSFSPALSQIPRFESYEATYNAGESNEHGSGSRVASLNRFYRRKLSPAMRVRARYREQERKRRASAHERNGERCVR